MLGEAELRARARRIRWVVSDVDGVLTDAGVFYSERGEELKRFSMRDGMGVERLRAAGIETAFLTRERTGFAPARAAKLGVRLVHTGVLDKLADLPRLERETGAGPGQLAYIGDDVNDAAIMARIVEAGGLTAAPADAFEAATRAALYATRANGGQGAFREFAEWILALRAP